MKPVLPILVTDHINQNCANLLRLTTLGTFCRINSKNLFENRDVVLLDTIRGGIEFMPLSSMDSVVTSIVLSCLIISLQSQSRPHLWVIMAQITLVLLTIHLTSPKTLTRTDNMIHIHFMIAVLPLTWVVWGVFALVFGMDANLVFEVERTSLGIEGAFEKTSTADANLECTTPLSSKVVSTQPGHDIQVHIGVWQGTAVT
jgi:hypothetical protein